jgi:hypothetical protein
VDRQSEQRLRAALAVEVLDEPGQFVHAGLANEIGDLLGIDPAAENQQAGAHKRAECSQVGLARAAPASTNPRQARLRGSVAGTVKRWIHSESPSLHGVPSACSPGRPRT